MFTSQRFSAVQVVCGEFPERVLLEGSVYDWKRRQQAQRQSTKKGKAAGQKIKTVSCQNAPHSSWELLRFSTHTNITYCLY